MYNLFIQTAVSISTYFIFAADSSFWFTDIVAIVHREKTASLDRFRILQLQEDSCRADKVWCALKSSLLFPV